MEDPAKRVIAPNGCRLPLRCWLLCRFLLLFTFFWCTRVHPGVCPCGAFPCASDCRIRPGSALMRSVSFLTSSYKFKASLLRLGFPAAPRLPLAAPLQPCCTPA